MTPSQSIIPSIEPKFKKAFIFISVQERVPAGTRRALSMTFDPICMYFVEAKFKAFFYSVSRERQLEQKGDPSQLEGRHPFTVLREEEVVICWCWLSGCLSFVLFFPAN
ncbi:hypothetical protein AVEN_212797-1 [Araneus ventricosus]|uniref:Uncharacterized protein n=1 Tax=Araneus ventricosus TaxID=182803 RepID=A0A4Y2L050_ARAVE|nr:hypothetical protein AVEN_212797-1 [Araneus ventricosus]